MTRLFDPPAPVAVEIGPEGSPARIRDQPAEALSRWLVELDWWRSPVAREYWRLIVDGSVLCEVFHDLLLDAWFLERVYD
jgi:hypothetical protein